MKSASKILSSLIFSAGMLVNSAAFSQELHTVANFEATDVRLGDRNTSYLSIEFSPDSKYMAWVEAEGENSRVWISGINRDTGELIPANGKGFLVSEVSGASVGSPQWGEDNKGQFVATIDRSGRFVIARPQSSNSDIVEATVNTLAIAPDSSRAYAYPARLPQSDNSYLVYIKNDFRGNAQVFYFSMADPSNEKQVTSGFASAIAKTPPFLTTIFRWFDQLPIFTFGDYANQYLQIKQLDVSGFDPQPQAITNDQVNHVDDFPFRVGEQRYLIGSVNTQAVASLYQQASNGIYSFIRTFSLTPAETGFENPNWLSSIEPFEWKGKVYASFQVLDNGSPLTNVPGQIWLASLFDSSVKRRLNAPNTMIRRDPESVIGNSKVWIYYYGRPSLRSPWELHRLETGL